MKTLHQAAASSMLIGVVACSSVPPDTSPNADSLANAHRPSGMQESAEARAVLEQIRARFRQGTAEQSVHAEPSIEKFEVAGAWIRPIEQRAKDPRGAGLVLPTRLTGAFVMRDTDAGAWIEVRLVGAQPVVAQIAEGHVVYPRGYQDGAHVIHRPQADGTKDYIVFENEPGQPQVRYGIG